MMFTPAYWVAQAWYHRYSNRYADFSWGTNLQDEVVGCLLGGHGVSAEMNRAAFEHLKHEGVLDYDRCQINESDLYRLLTAPLFVRGRSALYRFPSRRSKFIVAALKKLAAETRYPSTPNGLRNWLLDFPGIGLKTASWITRNYLRTGEVAIIDIHIFRAGVIMGLFSTEWRPQRNYLAMEEKLLEFSKAIDIPMQLLDVLIWRTMKDARRIAITAYREAV